MHSLSAGTPAPSVSRPSTDPDLEPGFPVQTYEHEGSYHGGPANHVLVGNIDADPTSRSSRARTRSGRCTPGTPTALRSRAGRTRDSPVPRTQRSGNFRPRIRDSRSSTRIGTDSSSPSTAQARSSLAGRAMNTTTWIPRPGSRTWTATAWTRSLRRTRTGRCTPTAPMARCSRLAGDVRRRPGAAHARDRRPRRRRQPGDRVGLRLDHSGRLPLRMAQQRHAGRRLSRAAGQQLRTPRHLPGDRRRRRRRGAGDRGYHSRFESPGHRQGALCERRGRANDGRGRRRSIRERAGPRGPRRGRRAGDRRADGRRSQRLEGRRHRLPRLAEDVDVQVVGQLETR